MSQTQTSEAGIFDASNRFNHPQFPHGNFPISPCWLTYFQEWIENFFPLRHDLETIFVLNFFLVILWSDMWIGCVFHHLHLVWVATSGAHYSGAGPITNFLNPFVFLKQIWNSCSAYFLGSPGQMHMLMDVTQMQKINHIILSNGSMCTLSNTSSNAECGVWKYETTTENRNQNSLQMCASQRAKSGKSEHPSLSASVTRTIF